MKKVILVIALASAIVMVSTCTKQQPLEGKCELGFKAAKNPEEILSLAYQYQNAIVEKPSQLKDLPKRLSGDFKYFLAKLADKEIPVILDSYQNLNHSVLYLDTNGDGHLSDEKGYTAKQVRNREFSSQKYYRFGPIPVEFGDAERKVKTKLEVVTRSWKYLGFYPAGYRLGKVRLGKSTYKVAVIDGNFDGRYDKLFSPPFERFWSPGCDSFAIDLNKDNSFDFHYYTHSEVMPLSRMVKIGDVYYCIDVAVDGTALELKRVEPEFGTLDLGGAKVKLKFWPDAAAQYGFYLEKSWQLPAGKYAAIFMVLHKRDSSGNEWTFSISGKKGKLDDFEIRPGETTSFKIGPPFQIKTTARQSSNTVSIGFDLQGQAGELYSPGVKRNGRMVTAPGFTIVDKSGNVLASGRFKYG